MENTHLTMLEDDALDLCVALANATNDRDRAHYRSLLTATMAEIEAIRKGHNHGLDPRRVSTLALTF